MTVEVGAHGICEYAVARRGVGCGNLGAGREACLVGYGLDEFFAAQDFNLREVAAQCGAHVVGGRVGPGDCHGTVGVGYREVGRLRAGLEGLLYLHRLYAEVGGTGLSGSV